MSGALLTRVADSCAWLTLNRPKRRNALTVELVTELRVALADAAANDDVRAVVLGGSGGAFCAGADLKEIDDDERFLEQAEASLAQYHQLIVTLVNVPKPVIAMVDGGAVGFGCDLALACDFRVLSRAAYFQEKFVRIGLMPDGGGTLWLPRLIGVGPALAAMMLGDAIDSARALQLGLATAVVEGDVLMSTTQALVQRLADAPPLALANIKSAVRASIGDVDAALSREREGQLKLLASADFREGVSAWMEKRKAVFRGE